MNHLEPYMNDFLVHLQLERGYSPHTVSAYRSDLKHFFVIIKDISSSRDAVKMYVKSLVKRSVSKKTLNRKCSVLRSFFQYLKHEGLIDRQDVFHIPRYDQPTSLPIALSRDEMIRLLEAPQACRTGCYLRDQAILECLYATGLRVSELVSLKQSDVDENFLFVTVTGKGNKQRRVLLTDSAQVLLKQYRASLAGITPHESLFLTESGTSLTRYAVYQMVKKYAAYSGISNVSPHVLRHSFATHMLEGGAPLRDVQLLLGHEQLTSTQIYTHLSRNAVKRVYDASHPRAHV